MQPVNYNKLYSKYKMKYLECKLHNQSGGKYSLYTNEEKQEILDNYNKVVKANFTNVPHNVLLGAVKGLFLEDKKTDKELYNQLKEIHDNKDVPLIKDDSLSAWCNIATELYGLKVKDILNLEKGDKIDVVLFDRNVGDYMDGVVKKGQKYNPLRGVSKGKYTHDKNLQGTLQFYQGELLNNFEWELNVGSLGRKYFWGPYNNCLTTCNKECEQKCNPVTSEQLKDINKEILVGWRGPAILKSNINKLPKKVTQYDTWYDDYAPYKYNDWLHKK